MTQALAQARKAEVLETQAWDCDQWPDWLHKVVNRTCEVADRLDMSSEQAHAYAALAAIDAALDAPVPVEGVERELVERSDMEALAEAAVKAGRSRSSFAQEAESAYDEIADTAIRNLKEPSDV